MRAVLSFGVRDTTSGFVGMRREALERAGVEHTASEGYAFLVELKYLLVGESDRGVCDLVRRTAGRAVEDVGR